MDPRPVDRSPASPYGPDSDDARSAAIAGEPTALVVDDDPGMCEVVATTLRRGGFHCMVATTMLEAVGRLACAPTDVVVVDLALPGASGLELIDHVTAVYPQTAIVVLTGDSSRQTAADACRRGADRYVVKPVSATQLVLSVDGAIQTRRDGPARRGPSQADLTIGRLERVALARDRETGEHSDRMSEIVGILAEALGLDATAAADLRRASLLHDIGKVSTPDEILHKPGPLTAAERREMQRHTWVGHQILVDADDPVLDLAAEIALGHHERWDGTGYPQGLSGTSIPIGARLAAVADVFEAVTSKRPYHDPMPVDDARALIAGGSGTHFDPALVDAFVASGSIRRLARDIGRGHAAGPEVDRPHPDDAPVAGLPDALRGRIATSRPTAVAGT